MRNLIFFALFSALGVGCSSTKQDAIEERIEPSPSDRRLLRVEGISDPYSPKGQKRLQKLKQDREKVAKMKKSHHQRMESMRREAKP